MIKYDIGGLLGDYDVRWKLIAAQGGPVHIIGQCNSACTLVTAHVKKELLCFGPTATIASTWRD